MTGTTITVRRQILDVDVFGEESDGVLLQRRLPAVCADVVSPALEAGFAGIEVGGERVCIDRIMIELHGADLERLEAELAEAVRRGIEDYLRAHPLASLGDGALTAADGVHRTTEHGAVDDALVLFLRTGRLPWSMRLSPGQSFEDLVLDAWAADEKRPGPSPALRRRLVDAFLIPAARSRLVLQFTPRFAVTLLRGLSAHVATVTGELLGMLGTDGLPASLRRSFALRIWDAALIAAARNDHPSVADLVGEASVTARLTASEARRLSTLLASTWPDAAAALLVEIAPRGTGGESNVVRGDAQSGAEEADDVRTPGAGARSEARGDDGLGEETEGILVEEAGIVLLHPYLQRFFTGVGVCEGDMLVDPHRAVCLLHHLATGESTAAEHRVTLAKALCGIPLDEPVPADVGLTAADAEEAAALLEAVIAHWGSLGNTSPDGLREAFLHRDGVLSVDAWGDWVLRVESRTFDVLLDDLPWGMSVVAFPWMDRRLIVEWR